MKIIANRVQNQTEAKNVHSKERQPATASLVLFATGLCALMFAAAPPAHTGPFIVEDGKPRSEIVIAAQPPRTVLLAAWELQNYLRKIWAHGRNNDSVVFLWRQNDTCHELFS